MFSQLARAAKVFLVCSALVFAGWLVFASFLAFGFGGNPFDNNPFDDMAFNRSHWRDDANCSDGSNRRGHMAQDMIRHHLKSGMSEQEVIGLLGIPQVYSASEFQKYYGSGGFYLTDLPATKNQQPEAIFRYGLGEELDMAWGIDHADLYVYFRGGHYVGSRIGWPG